MGRFLFIAFTSILGATLAMSSTPAPVTSNLLTWLDPTAPNAYILSQNGTRISQWSDQSPFGRHFVQNNPAKQPAIVSLGARTRRDGDPCDYCGPDFGNGTSMIGSGGTIGSSPYRRRRASSMFTIPTAHLFVVSAGASMTDILFSESLFRVASPNGRNFVDVGHVEFAGGLGSAFAVSLNSVANAATAAASSSTRKDGALDVWAISVQPQMGWATRVSIYKNNAFLSSSVLSGTPPYGLTNAILGSNYSGVVAELMIYADMSNDGRAATSLFLCNKHHITC